MKNEYRSSFCQNRSSSCSQKKHMTAGGNVLLDTMELDKTVNQQRRPFIPKEEKKKKVNSTDEKCKNGRKYQLAKIDLN